MSDKYIVQINKLIIFNTEIIFDFPIKEVIQIEDMLIVYLDLDDMVISLEENIFGVSLSKKEIQWQVEKRNFPKGGYLKMHCPFTGISYSSNKLYLYNWCSTYLIVDPTSGKVLEQVENR